MTPASASTPAAITYRGQRRRGRSAPAVPMTSGPGLPSGPNGNTPHHLPRTLARPVRSVKGRRSPNATNPGSFIPSTEQPFRSAAPPGGHHERAELVAVQGGGMGLMAEPRPRAGSAAPRSVQGAPLRPAVRSRRRPDRSGGRDPGRPCPARIPRLRAPETGVETRSIRAFPQLRVSIRACESRTFGLIRRQTAHGGHVPVLRT
jgi:hypothetical protein